MVVSKMEMKYFSKLFWLFLFCFVERSLGASVSEHNYHKEFEHVDDSIINSHNTVGFGKETSSALEGCSRFTNCTSCVDAGCVFIECSVKNVTEKKFDPFCEKDNEIIQPSKDMCPGDLNNISQSALCGHANVDDEVNGFSSDVPNLNVYSTMDQSPSAEILTTSTNDTELPTTTSNAQSTVSAEEITTFSPDISTENKTSSVVSASSPSAAPLSARRFDAPSFIGGIVLSLGFLAILYVGFKFYKAHTERNYHTL